MADGKLSSSRVPVRQNPTLNDFFPTSGPNDGDNLEKITGITLRSLLGISANYTALTDAAPTAWAYSPSNRLKFWTIGGNRTLNLTNTVDGDFGVLFLIQDGSGNRVPSLPGYKPAGKTFSSGSGHVDMLTFTNRNGIIWWDIVNYGNIAPTSPVPTPTGFIATAQGTTQINLAWNDLSTETAYQLFFSLTNNFNSATALATLAANTTTYQHTGRQPDTTYYYWLIGQGNGSTTTNSAPATANAKTDAVSTNFMARWGVKVGGGALTQAQIEASVASGSFADGANVTVNYAALFANENDFRYLWMAEPSSQPAKTKTSTPLGDETIGSTTFANPILVGPWRFYLSNYDTNLFGGQPTIFKIV